MCLGVWPAAHGEGRLGCVALHEFLLSIDTGPTVASRSTRIKRGISPATAPISRRWSAVGRQSSPTLSVEGYEGLRVAASVPQLKEEHWTEFFDYEERLNRYLSDKTMLVLCAYPLPAPHAADVTRTHPSTIKKQRGEWEVQ